MGRTSTEIIVAVSCGRTLQTLRKGLGAEGFEVISAKDPSEFRTLIHRGRCGAVLLGIAFGNGDSLDLIREVRSRAPRSRLLVLAGEATAREIALAHRAGAPECLTSRVDPVSITAWIRKEPGSEFHIVDAHGYPSLWTVETRELYRLLVAAARTGQSILITGESGTGKEIAARTAHEVSPRSKAPFVAVNCAALTPTLLESELFGHVKGAFTNATGERRGRLECTKSGTLFLDEISELPPGLQAKLLRVLQECSYERVGSDEGRRFAGRVITSSNRDLSAEVAAGRFRKDLYYRLEECEISLPPLRSRRSDIEAYLDHFLGGDAGRVTREARDILNRYSWPGNIRELKNLIGKLRLEGHEGTIGPSQLPIRFRRDSNAMPEDPGIERARPRTLREVEAAYLKRILAECEGNLTMASRILDLDRGKLRRRLEKLAIRLPVRKDRVLQ